MTVTPYAPRQLPGIRERLIEDLSRPPGASPMLDVFALHVKIGIQVPADPRVRDPAAQAMLLAAGELARLRDAELFWASPEMTALTLAAAPGMPPFRPGPADLPAPAGLMYFAAPVDDYEPVLRMGLEYADGTTVAALPTSSYQLRAVSWGPYDQQGAWRHGGTWFTFWTQPADGDAAETATHAGLDADAALRYAAMLPPLRLDNEAKIPAHASDDAHGDARLADLANPEMTAYWAHIALAAFRLMATAKAVRATAEAPPGGRQARRRAERAGVASPAAPVRLVDVAGPAARSRPAPAQSGGREYSCRWMVSGHWRNHWYPKREVHRPMWIDAHPAGPKDKPLRVRPTVNVWRA